MGAKYIFVTGGVISSLGKGISASALGQLLKSHGFNVFIQKFDPYLNVDPGMMSPYQHGEVFVTNDGAETDLDLGHYERFIDINLTQDSSVTTGQIYQTVINNERSGKYLGSTVQVIPHITDEIKKRLHDASINSKADIIITEIGGTVGDIESLPYLEAIRQVRHDYGHDNTIYIHNTLVPYVKATNELKTKPTQHSVKELRSLGIQPDIIILRSDLKISDEAKEKIALFCDVNKKAVFESLGVDVIYEIIVNFKKQQIDNFVLNHFKLKSLQEPNITPWVNLIDKIKTLKNEVTVGLVGKYTSLHDAYLSVTESLYHAGYSLDTKVIIKWIDAEKITNENVSDNLKNLDGIIVPGGFGKRATKGLITSINYARLNNFPFFGICFGMQLALIEYFQNELKLEDANSTEINPDTKTPVIKQRDSNTLKNGLRLGLYELNIKKGTKIYDAYQKELIAERHRHRYEFNHDYINNLKDSDFILSSYSRDEKVLSAIEHKNHPWFLAVQYHPEFLSRPLRAHPLFISFIKMLKSIK
ncbi:MAG: CTP synthase [Acholeplasmataceae bacterium]